MRVGSWTACTCSDGFRVLACTSESGDSTCTWAGWNAAEVSVSTAFLSHSHSLQIHLRKQPTKKFLINSLRPSHEDLQQSQQHHNSILRTKNTAHHSPNRNRGKHTKWRCFSIVITVKVVVTTPARCLASPASAPTLRHPPTPSTPPPWH